MKRTFALVFLLLALSSPAASQATEAIGALAPGSRVRLTVPTIYRNRWVVGTVESADSGTLVLRTEREGQTGSFPIPFVAIDQIHLSRGRVTAKQGSSVGAREGALAGVGVGALAGFFIGGRIVDGDVSRAPSFEHAAMGGAVLGLAGWGLGYILGEQERELWEPLSTTGFKFGMMRDPRIGGISIAIGR